MSILANNCQEMIYNRKLKT